jgi:hypothetical protein
MSDGGLAITARLVDCWQSDVRAHENGIEFRDL